MALNLRFSDDYAEYFNSKEYLQKYYKTPEDDSDEGDGNLQSLILTNFHKFWSNFSSSDVTMLEFGGGPSIHTLISACPYVKEIIFAEFTEPNRKEVEAWCNRESSAHDWTTTFEYVVQILEKKSKVEATKREEELRKKISHIIPCDIRESKPLQLPESLTTVPLLFDVVSSTLCIQAAVESDVAYHEAVVKLIKLLNPGGHLVLAGVTGEPFYEFGGETFYSFPLSEAVVLQGLKEAGLQDVECISSQCVKTDGVDGVYFAYGKLPV